MPRTRGTGGETRLRPLHDRAKQGLTIAQYNLGGCYAIGKGVDVDKTKTAQLYCAGMRPSRN
jgi:TPR repeat protein